MTTSQKQIADTILAQIPKLFLADEGKDEAPRQCLASSIGALDRFLEGGMRVGSLIEWGAPLGRGGRDIILRYLTGENDQAWCLWVCSKKDVRVYPPAWSARGVPLSQVRFAYSDEPVRDLKPVFYDSFFRLVVIDGAKLSMDDCAFLAQRARASQQTIMVVRNYFLNEKQGNIWARLRLNCWQDSAGGRFHVRVVRGLPPRHLSLTSLDAREENVCL